MSHRTQAYLIVDAGTVSPAALEQAVRQIRAACALLRLPAGYATGDPHLALLVRAVQGANCAALIDGDAKVALELGADGVHLAHNDDSDLAGTRYRTARAILGAGRIVGASCGLSRHNAMVLADLGADYVALGGAPDYDAQGQLEMATWWADLFSVPCVAWSVADRQLAAQLASVGADFIAAGPPLSLEHATATLTGLLQLDEAGQ